ERQPVLLRPAVAVLDIAAERLLLHVEIEGGDAPARLQQRHDQMHGEGRLPASPLVIADHDDAWAEVSLRKLRTQHGRTLLVTRDATYQHGTRWHSNRSPPPSKARSYRSLNQPLRMVNQPVSPQLNQMFGTRS